jgi:hypothetical protein
VTYDAGELRRLTASTDHRVRVAELRDRFGDYGIIGLAVTELTADDAVLRLMLMSCRVASRGVGTVLLDQLVREAVDGGRRPLAHFVPTEANRNMLVTLRFAGFVPLGDGTGGGTGGDGQDAAGGTGKPVVLAFDPQRLGPPQHGHVRVVSGTD